MITVSIVSHRHGQMVSDLVGALIKFPTVTSIIVTINIDEVIYLPSSDKITIINNKYPKGYGENHNNAFQYCEGEYFCVLNPDIVFLSDPFPLLIDTLRETGAKLVSPRIINNKGEIEDAAREFPTLLRLAKKALGLSTGAYNTDDGDIYLFPDWIAGMFMLFEVSAYRELCGFDEAYFMYYEDADICRHLRSIGGDIVVCLSVSVIHNARRDSRKKWRHLSYHLRSMLRFLLRSRAFSASSSFKRFT